MPANRETQTPLALLIDAGFMFSIARRLGVPRPDYRELVEVAAAAIRRSSGLAVLPQDISAHLWTSAPFGKHEGFDRFVEFLESQLGFRVYTTAGAESYLADVRGLVDAVAIEQVNLRLQRHDAHLAFVTGLVANTHCLAAVSDSFAVAEALRAAAERRGGRNFLLAPRSHLQRYVVDHLEENRHLVEFIDLDDSLELLFPKAADEGRPRRRLPTDL